MVELLPVVLLHAQQQAQLAATQPDRAAPKNPVVLNTLPQVADCVSPQLLPGHQRTALHVVIPHFKYLPREAPTKRIPAAVGDFLVVVVGREVELGAAPGLLHAHHAGEHRFAVASIIHPAIDRVAVVVGQPAGGPQAGLEPVFLVVQPQRRSD